MATPPQLRRRQFAARAVVVAGLAIGGGLGCSSSSTNNDAAVNDDAAAAGGPVAGEVDMHCSGMTPITVDPLSCNAPAPDAGATSADGGAAEMAATMFNAEGDDDDCKYHLKFSATPVAVAQNTKMTFKLTVTKLVGGAPASGAINAQGDGIAIEGYLDGNNFHVLPNTTPPMAATETPAGSGVYTITPVQFDRSGRWVMRFHLYETCTDNLEDSPHGHAAFFFDVP